MYEYKVDTDMRSGTTISTDSTSRRQLDFQTRSGSTRVSVRSPRKRVC